MKLTLPPYKAEMKDEVLMNFLHPHLTAFNKTETKIKSDGNIGFHLDCPFCGCSDAKIFSKKVKKKKKVYDAWVEIELYDHYFLCNKGHKTCELRGLHTLKHFYRSYRGLCEGKSRHNDQKIRLSEKKQHFVY